jgi:hypothetical protein
MTNSPSSFEPLIAIKALPCPRLDDFLSPSRRARQVFQWFGEAHHRCLENPKHHFIELLVRHLVRRRVARPELANTVTGRSGNPWRRKKPLATAGPRLSRENFYRRWTQINADGRDGLSIRRRRRLWRDKMGRTFSSKDWKNESGLNTKIKGLPRFLGKCHPCFSKDWKS